MSNGMDSCIIVINHLLTYFTNKDIMMVPIKVKGLFYVYNCINGLCIYHLLTYFMQGQSNSNYI
jgi:hypothetical protein